MDKTKSLAWISTLLTLPTRGGKTHGVFARVREAVLAGARRQPSCAPAVAAGDAAPSFGESGTP